MFEREIQRAKELLSQRLTSAEQFVYWQEIRERADIPVFYRNFFGAESQWWVFEEQLQRAANPRFDYAHEMLAQHIVEADRYRMEAARFDRQDLAATIDLAVKTRFNYVLRPRTTLKWFVYRGEPTKTLSEVLLRMDYFLEYDYLLDGFRKWISAKQQEQTSRQALLVSVVEFDRTIQTVDNDVILEYSPEEFTDLLTPIYEIFDEIHAADRSLQQYRGKAPMPAIIIFLDDKGIYRIAQELEEIMKKRALRYVGQREFLHLLNDIINKLEHETPVNAAEHEDLATLPLGFDDEPIIKADDTIGELAIGAAIRKPKFPHLAADKPMGEPITSNQQAQSPHDNDAEPETTTQTDDNATDELPEGFGMELASLAEALRAAEQDIAMGEANHDLAENVENRSFTPEQALEETPHSQETPPENSSHNQSARNSTVQSVEIKSDTQDADYVFVHSSETNANAALAEEQAAKDSENVAHSENGSENAAQSHTAQIATPPTTERAEQKYTGQEQDSLSTSAAKSTLFSRWSSIFVPKNEQ